MITHLHMERNKRYLDRLGINRIHHMVRLQTNGHVNGVGDYGKGGKMDYEKIG